MLVTITYRLFPPSHSQDGENRARRREGSPRAFQSEAGTKGGTPGCQGRLRPRLTSQRPGKSPSQVPGYQVTGLVTGHPCPFIAPRLSLQVLSLYPEDPGRDRAAHRSLSHTGKASLLHFVSESGELIFC